MPPYLRKQAIRYPVYALLSVGVLIIGVLAYYNWIYALLASLFFVAFVFMGLLIVNAVRKETEVYISTLSYRLTDCFAYLLSTVTSFVNVSL